MKKQIYLIITVIIMICVFTLSFNKNIDVKADSGFDTSYDSSFGSSGSSSFGSSGSSSGGSFSFPEMFYLLILILILKLVDKFITRIKKKLRYYKMQQLNRGVKTIDEVKKYIPNFDYNKFLTDRFNDYVTIQNAWMNFDYETLRSKLTDELYNQYIMQLDTMKIKGEKNIMKNFKHIGTNIIDIKEENGNIEITTQMIASFNDYIVNSHGTVVRGNRTKKLTVCYKIKFVCSKQALVDKCPNCNAPLSNSASQTCKYCNSVITQSSTNWVMTKKQVIMQR